MEPDGAMHGVKVLTLKRRSIAAPANGQRLYPPGKWVRRWVGFGPLACFETAVQAQHFVARENALRVMGALIVPCEYTLAVIEPGGRDGLWTRDEPVWQSQAFDCQPIWQRGEHMGAWMLPKGTVLAAAIRCLE